MFAVVFTLICGFLTFFFAVYLYGYYLSFYWTKKGVPSPKIRKNFIENQASFLFDPFFPGIFLLKKWSNELGKVYGYLEGFRRVLVVSDPILANEVMVKKFDVFHGRKLNPIVGDVVKDERVHVFNAKGARWKRLRTIANPCFSVSNLKKILPTVEDTADCLIDFLDKKAEDGQEFNIHPYFHEYTLDIICRVAMGQKGSKIFENPMVEDLLATLFKFANNPWDYFAHVFPESGPWLRFFILKFYSKIKKVPIVIFFNKIFDAIEKRRTEREEMKNDGNSERSIDFIDLFLDAENSSVVDEDFISTGLKVSKKLTTQEIAGQCFVFLLAGFDTTANTLAITSFYLARNSKIQEKLIKEVDEIFGNGADFSYENVNKLKYGDCVMKEALRMFPIAAFAASRECQQLTTLSNGIQLEPGDCVALDLYTLHYDKKIWGEDADEFNPERFMDFTPEKQMAYYPFGGGPRICIGMRLAYLEEKMLLAKILQKYYFDVTNEEKLESAPQLIGNTIHNPKKVNILLKNRE